MGIPYGDVTDGVDAKADGEASAKLEGVGSAYGYATAGVSAGDDGAGATDGVDENPADPVGAVAPRPIDGVDAPVEKVAAGVAVAIEYVEDAPDPSADGVSARDGAVDDCAEARAVDVAAVKVSTSGGVDGTVSVVAGVADDVPPTGVGVTSAGDGVSNPTDGVLAATEGVVDPTDGVPKASVAVGGMGNGVGAPIAGVINPVDGVPGPGDAGTRVDPIEIGDDMADTAATDGVPRTVVATGVNGPGGTDAPPTARLPAHQMRTPPNVRMISQPATRPTGPSC